MRIPILICALLVLTACGSKSGEGNLAAGEENAAGEMVVTNDVTAIDAATGEAANMAPDVNYTFNEMNLASTNEGSAAPAPRPTRRMTVKPAGAAPANTLATPAPPAPTNTL